MGKEIDSEQKMEISYGALKALVTSYGLVSADGSLSVKKFLQGYIDEGLLIARKGLGDGVTSEGLREFLDLTDQLDVRQKGTGTEHVKQIAADGDKEVHFKAFEWLLNMDNLEGVLARIDLIGIFDISLSAFLNLLVQKKILGPNDIEEKSEDAQEYVKYMKGNMANLIAMNVAQGEILLTSILDD